MLKKKIDISGLTSGGIGILGIPFDRNSSYMKGAALAPRKIMEALFSESSNLWSENRLDLGREKNLIDLGDVFNSDDQHNAFDKIREATDKILETKAKLISLGGDHSITYPIIQSHALHYSSLNILHLDAHPDLYDKFDNNKHSHASPFARIMENKLVSRLVQVGIRTMSGHQDEQARRFDVEVIHMKDLNSSARWERFDGPIYLSLDLDCLDPAFAPGVSHHEPGGMTTRQVIEIIQNLEGRLIGADIVEYNPERDLTSMTAMVAAKLLKEIIAKMVEQ